jgi:hypothetical protein
MEKFWEVVFSMQSVPKFSNEATSRVGIKSLSWVSWNRELAVGR